MGTVPEEGGGGSRLSEQRFRTLFENAADVISFVTCDGVIIDANPRWEEVLGVPRAEIIGRRVRDFAPAGQEEAIDGQFLSSIARGVGRAPAIPIRRADGATIYLEFSLTMLETEGEPIAALIGHEVTAAVLAAESLRTAEERYRSLIERIPDSIWAAREDGAITFVTPNIANLLGTTVEQMCAQGIAGRLTEVHDDDRAAVVTALDAFMKVGKVFDLEYRRRHEDGHWMWVRNRSIARYEREGVRYMEGMLTDITDHRNLEESFRQAQKMEAIGQLTGGIAHDFNNILAAILAHSHFLLEDLAEHDPRRSDVDEIRKAAERAASLSRQLLAFSRRQVLEPTTTNLGAVVTNLHKMLVRLIGEDLELTVRCAEGLGAVRVDVGQLEQVVMNLVVNARDAMPDGGKIVIETTNVELGDQDRAPGGPPPGSYVMLAVSDSGCGMDAETQSHVFEPFFTTKEVGKGTGLGLSTCYGIVKQSGGHIMLRSDPGTGSVFEIYLPRLDEAPAQSAHRAASEDVGGDETILLVEDDDAVRAAVSRLLAQRGYHVIVARGGDDAVEAVRRHAGPVHLIVSDVIMPGGSGPEVVQRIRELVPSARALFMSGYADHPALRSRGVADGVVIIQKPFAPVALARRIRETLDT